MTTLLSISFPFFGLIFLGFIAGRLVRPPQSLAWLNTFVLYFALPALFFQLISKTPISELANGAFVLTTTFATYVAFSLAFAVGAILTKGDIAKSTIQGALGSYSNTGYLGPGLTLAALGPAATVPTALIFSFDNALLFTIVPLLMALGGTTGAKISTVLKTVARQIGLHPVIMSTVVGIFAAAVGFTPPQPVDRFLTMLSAAAAPCALFAIGVTVAQRPIKRVPTEIPLLIVCKLLIHPALVLALLMLVGDFDPIWVYTAVLMAALPPAANVYVMAQQYSVYLERASSTILIGTAVSVVTVTVLIYLISNDLLPL